MDLEEIWLNFSNEMAEISNARMRTKKLYIAKYNELLEKKKNNIRLPTADGRLLQEVYPKHFRDHRTGQYIRYSAQFNSIDEVIELFKHRRNREYQFLLVEAYECFSKAIQQIFSYMKKTNDSFYQFVKDDKDANKKKPITNKILPLILVYLDCNIEYFDLTVKRRILFINLLRNQIVHEMGIIDNEEDFKNKIIKEGSYTDNKIACDAIINFTDNFIGDILNKKVINLDTEIIAKGTLEEMRERLELLFDDLLFCIYVIYDKAKNL